MILEDGDRILVAHRRLFRDDEPRYFAGVVERYEDGVARVMGYSWVREPLNGDLQRSPDARTKIVSLSSGTLFVYRLPQTADIEKLRIDHGPNCEVFLTDGGSLRMDLSERRA